MYNFQVRNNYRIVPRQQEPVLKKVHTPTCLQELTRYVPALRAHVTIHAYAPTWLQAHAPIRAYMVTRLHAYGPTGLLPYTDLGAYRPMCIDARRFARCNPNLTLTLSMILQLKLVKVCNRNLVCSISSVN